MTNGIRYLAQHFFHAGVSPLSKRDRRDVRRVARRIYAACSLNQVFEGRQIFGQRVAVVGGSWAFRNARMEQLASMQPASSRLAGEGEATGLARPAPRVV